MISFTRNVAIIFALACGVCHAGHVDILSGSNWKSTNSFEAGYTEASFDDSSWRNAFELYGGAGVTDLNGAKHIWDYAGTVPPTSTTLPLESFFRSIVSFESNVTRALFSYSVDDEMDLYINNQLVVRDRSNGANNAYGIDVTRYLSSGANVVALYAYDGGSGGPQYPNAGGGKRNVRPGHPCHGGAAGL